MKQKKIAVAYTIVVLITVGAVFYLHAHRNSAPDHKITGTVGNIIDKPNMAEDGYYGFEVTGAAGQIYTVNATGYLNTPLSPDDQGEVCVDIPRVKTGATVEFNLPKIKGEQNKFDICYAKHLKGYYFKIVH